MWPKMHNASWPSRVPYEHHVFHMTITCFIWPSCVSYDYHVFHLVTTCFIWPSRVSYGHHVNHMDITCFILPSCVSYGHHMFLTTITCFSRPSRVSWPDTYFICFAIFLNLFRSLHLKALLSQGTSRYLFWLLFSLSLYIYILQNNLTLFSSIFNFNINTRCIILGEPLVYRFNVLFFISSICSLNVTGNHSNSHVFHIVS